MIKFKAVTWSNFLSTGDKPTTILLDRSPTTLIVGHNGAGKSTLLDALSFALFGKPHRNIKKDQLVNTINKKGTVVEVSFSIGSHSFKIKRGIKPKIFEIWQNGKMINQSSTVKDYQKYLESNILKLNHKSFHQIVVLGSSSFVPFMQLQASHRREVIEDLLDINIFSKMNQILKEKAAAIRNNINSTQYQLDLTKDNIETQNRLVNSIRNMNESYSSKNIEEISRLTSLKGDYIKEGADLEVVIKGGKHFFDRQKVLTEDLRTLATKQGGVKSKLKELAEQIKFFDHHDVCPTCSQDIDEDTKGTHTKHLKDSIKDNLSATEEYTSTIASLHDELDDVVKEIEVVNAARSRIQTLFQLVQDIDKNIAELNTDAPDTTALDLEVSTYEGLLETKESLLETYSKHLEDRSYSDASSEMLKDSGIKTKIIKEYLPVMNKLVNQYLSIMDFFVKFELDENFNETIKSRHRDAFNYDSFSEGEKMKIDLSLLFTWRMIAKMKNSTSTNLLILDETFDSSLDNDGIDNLLKIIYTFDEKSNIFIISHKGDVLDGKFRSKIEFVKEKNFSKIKQ